MRILNDRLIILACFILILSGIACSQAETRDFNNTKDLPDDISKLIELLGQPEQGNTNEIIQKLADMGEEAIPDLIEALTDEDARVGAGHALARIGEPAVPALIDALQSENYQVRYSATNALGEIGPDAVDAVMPLQNLFGRTTKTEQINIMHNLVIISPSQDVIMMIRASLIVNGLRHDALLVLGEVGPDAAGAAGAIIGLLEDEDQYVRYDAIEALSGIGPVEGVVEGITACVTHEEVRVREHAVKVLGTFGQDAAFATQALADTLNDEEPGVQRAAAKSLGQIAPASRDAIDDLINALSLDDPLTRNEAIKALGQFGSESSGALPKLRELAESDAFDYIRTSANEAIAIIEINST